MGFKVPIRVYIEDTDAGGIVFYGNYLKFFERARTEYLRAAGIEQSETMTFNLCFVVRKAEIEYHRPARLDDLLWVSCDVETQTPTRVVFSQSARLQSDDSLCVSARVEVVSVRLDTLKPMAMPNEVRLRLNTVIETPHVE